MTQPRRRPTAPPRAPVAGYDEPERQPLARVVPAAPRQGRQGAQTRTPQARAHQPPVTAPVEPVGGELQLGFGMIVVSLPVAFSFGQMLIDRSLDAMPQMVGWTALVLAYKGITAPGVARGFLDWTGDSINLGPELRERLGIPEALPKVAPRPRTRGVVGWTDGLVADVKNLRAAVAARRGDVIEGVRVPDDSSALVSRAGRAGTAAWSARAASGADADGAAVDALDDDADADEPPDAPDIGLPVVRLEDIADLDNLWVVGPKGSGKTTILRRLLELRRGKHWAIDPHATPGKWMRCTVVGGGRDFAAIDHQINTFIGWMDGRYKHMGTGRITEAACKAARRTLVGDEWRAIRKNLPGAKDAPSASTRLLDILSEGRKAGICALAASHLDTAEGMGISGEKDMLKCFDMIIYLGAMATKCVPAAARMARPAVVYDPEHDVWAQLLIALPTQPDGEALEDDEEDAPAQAVAAPQRQRQAMSAAASARPAPAPLDDMLTGLLAGIAAPPPDPALASDLSAVSPARAARLAAIMGRQGAAPVAVAAPVVAPRAPVSTGSIGRRRRVDRPARTTEPSEPSGAAVAPSGAAVPAVAPSGAAAPAVAPSGAAVPALEVAPHALVPTAPPSGQTVAGIAAVPLAPAAEVLEETVIVDQPGGNRVIVNVLREHAGKRTPATKKARQGARITDDRRLARIAYYTHAAHDQIPFTRAYQRAPTGLGKGNHNAMHAIYQAAKVKDGTP